MIGFSPRRSLTAHHDWKEVLETLRAKFHTYASLPSSLFLPLGFQPINVVFSVKLPKSFVAINLSEKVPDAFSERRSNGNGNSNGGTNGKAKALDHSETMLPPPALDG